MKTILWYFFESCLCAVSVVLALMAPDLISIVLTAVMAVVVVVSVWIGLFPLVRYVSAFHTARGNIRRAVDMKAEDPWSLVCDMDSFFGHRELDGIFREYREKARRQSRSGVVVTELDELVNEDFLAARRWQGLMYQIPGTLTGLGILGTFIGLIVGIRSLQFETMPAALDSIQRLLSGVTTAFYTSIAGVILSILFNILYKSLWNVLMRELGIFQEEFKWYVIPPEDEQYRFRQKKEMQKILDKLDRLPRSGEFSLARSAAAAAGGGSGNEALLLSQISSGLQKGEFLFYLQPSFDLNSRKIVAAEALVRWNHPKLGLIMPGVFMPLIEDNGYITKLDCYIWELVCQTVREWIDSGKPVVPISVNVSKTDILAMDVGEFFNTMVKKYRIPPRYLRMDIAENAYLQTRASALESENILRQRGFQVALDGFNGDFLALNSIGELHADAVKLDMRFVKEKNLAAILEQASKLKWNLEAEGIESMEQMSQLRKSGCSVGQGYYLSKPMEAKRFEEELSKAIISQSRWKWNASRRN